MNSIATIKPAALPLQPITWDGMHRKYLNLGEMEVIVALVRSVNAKTMTEIGCRDGRTAHVLLRNVPTIEHYLGIDVPMSYVPNLEEQRMEMVPDPGYFANADPRFNLAIEPHGSLDFTVLDPCDAIFIDGDHSYSVVSHDSLLAWNAVRGNGVIIWHDYLNDHINDVSNLLQELASSGWPITHVAGTWLAYCRMQ